jgi:hypothetical protein
MTHLKQAIDLYHALLLTDEVASESQWQLDDQQRRRGLFFGTRPICSVLRPRFLTTAQYHFLQRAHRMILPAFGKAEQAALSNADVMAQFMLSDWEKALVPFEPGFPSSPNGRMDCFWMTDDDTNGVEAGTLAMTEYNAETPAAVAYNDELAEIFYGLPVMREFEKQYECRSLPGRHLMLHTLNDCYRSWGKTSSAPASKERMRIGIVDWKEVPTYSEFVLFEKYFKEQGYECVICDPREMDYRDGKLYSGEFHINLIYKRVLLTELVTRSPEGLNHPIIKAINDRNVCMVNPYRCKILHQKASLAVLSDEDNAGLFSADEQRAIHAYIPWTRRLSERYTIYEGARVDLVPFLRDNKDIFVLKPNDEYGGKGIVLGWTVTQSEWEQKLSDYLKENTIVQRKVAIPSEPYPSFVDGKAEVYDRMLDTDPYLWNGDTAQAGFASGCLTRLSTSALLNVTAGGGSTVPTFVIEER